MSKTVLIAVIIAYHSVSLVVAKKVATVVFETFEVDGAIPGHYVIPACRTAEKIVNNWYKQSNK